MLAERLRFEKIDRLQDALALHSQWVELWECCPYATVFQSPEWVLGSWRHLSEGGQRVLLIVRHAGALLALAALRFSSKEVTLEGSEVSDYLDILVDPRFRDVLLEQFSSVLAEICRTRCIRFERLTAASPLLDLQPSAGGWQSSRSEQDVCPYVGLSTAAANLASAIPHGFFGRVEQSRRAAARRFRMDVSGASASDASARLERLFDLHTGRWNQRCQPGVFADPAVQRFHRQVVPRLVARDQAWLLELQFDGAPVAALLAFCGHGRALYYIGGFDPRYAAHSPGRLLLAALFERALASGCVEIDFLRGTERYKYDWGARNRSTYCITLRPAESRQCAAG